jgi:hypothetical protein
MVPIEIVGAVPNVRQQLFIAPPPLEDDDYRARQWALSRNVAILPKYACNEQMLTTQPQAFQNQVGFAAQIDSPAPGQTIPAGQQIVITGTATFPQGGFYKIEIAGPGFARWTTASEINDARNRSGVVNGALQELPPLPPGTYELQLVVVGPDANIGAISTSVFIIPG